MWHRAIRAKRHTRRLDFWYSVFPGLVVGIATMLATMYVTRNDEHTKTSTVVIPALIGFAALAVALILIHGVEFAYRFITGKAPAGRKRTLYGICTNSVEANLRENIPTGGCSILIPQGPLEVHEFALEIKGLLDSSNWHAGIGSGVGYDKLPTDVTIYLPVGGNDGLSALGKLLSTHGYRATVTQGGGIANATIEIGEASL